jgi:hypothetical protein
VVNFGGALVDSATPNSDGSYAELEQLPALGTVTAQVTDGAGQQSDVQQVNITTPAPTITLTYSYGAGGAVTLSGQVSGQTPSNLTVTIAGAVGAQVTTDSSGNFSFTSATQVEGNITAQTTDVWGQGSNTASVALENLTPTITTFQAVAGIDNLWTFQGHVSATYAPGLTVRLSGIPTLNGSNGSTAVTVDANGNFALTVQLRPNESGVVTAVFCDWLGIQSNVACVFITGTCGGGWPAG